MMNQSIKPGEPRIIVALDFSNEATAMSLVEKLDPKLCRLKVGKELFTSSGPRLVEKLTSKGYEIFLDLKFHDIPNTVAKACEAACKLGVWMLNVHASGGSQMMQAAREAVDKSDLHPYLIAVTVLTSMNESTLREIGIQTDLKSHVMHLAKLAERAALDGVVCSAEETMTLRKNLGSDFCLVTPGIRLIGANSHDQSRVVTPRNAIELGSSYLVIGRPITQSDDPIATLNQIHNELTMAK